MLFAFNRKTSYWNIVLFWLCLLFAQPKIYTCIKNQWLLIECLSVYLSISWSIRCCKLNRLDVFVFLTSCFPKFTMNSLSNHLTFCYMTSAVFFHRQILSSNFVRKRIHKFTSLEMDEFISNRLICIFLPHTYTLVCMGIISNDSFVLSIDQIWLP